MNSFLNSSIDICDKLSILVNSFGIKACSPKKSGIYNVGTGKARTFNDLAKALFNELKIPIDIDYIDTPSDIRDKYQYFTQADMSKLRKIGYNTEFTELEDGISDYVKNYLTTSKYF